MARALVIIGGPFETVVAVMLKFSEGFTKLWPTVGFAFAVAISTGLLGLGLRELPVGIMLNRPARPTDNERLPDHPVRTRDKHENVAAAEVTQRRQASRLAVGDGRHNGCCVHPLCAA
jgi:Small Multidrug Resistance protein